MIFDNFHNDFVKIVFFRHSQNDHDFMFTQHIDPYRKNYITHFVNILEIIAFKAISEV